MIRGDRTVHRLSQEAVICRAAVETLAHGVNIAKVADFGSTTEPVSPMRMGSPRAALRYASATACCADRQT
jgi:hypothetical protein